VEFRRAQGCELRSPRHPSEIQMEREKINGAAANPFFLFEGPRSRLAVRGSSPEDLGPGPWARFSGRKRAPTNGRFVEVGPAPFFERYAQNLQRRSAMLFQLAETTYAEVWWLRDRTQRSDTAQAVMAVEASRDLAGLRTSGHWFARAGKRAAPLALWRGESCLRRLHLGQDQCRAG